MLVPSTRHPQAVLIEQEIMPGKWDCLVTSYEMCMREKSVMKKFVWEYIVIDEAHRIKNEHSKLSVVLREVESRNRYGTGEALWMPAKPDPQHDTERRMKPRAPTGEERRPPRVL